MAYPKPLSEKNIARMYENAGLTEKQIDFLHTFFTVCTNLYGVIFAGEAWEVYSELSAKTETVMLSKRDMYAALEIMRRENLSFYVYEIDEIYSEECRKEEMRIIARRDLILWNVYGYRKYINLYDLVKASSGKPFYVPENLLSFTVLPETRYERELLELFDNLKSTCSEFTDVFGLAHKCPYTGKYLREFSYISEDVDFELRWMRGEIKGHNGNPKKAKEYEAKLKSIKASRYLLNKLKRENSIGAEQPDEIIEDIFDDLKAMGISLLNARQNEKLLQAIYDMCNNQHLWCNHGWTPSELFAHLNGGGVPAVGFGTDMKKSFVNGTIDKEKLIRKLSEKGFKI